MVLAAFRIDYIFSHLAAARAAIGEGVNFQGFFLLVTS